jgi:hypothetical protein
MKTPEEFAYALWYLNLASGEHPDYLDEVITRLTAWRDECVVEHDMRIAESKRLRTEMEPPV